ncbi:hypothetical protein ACRTAL_001082 [Clostridium perfringens]|uniref:Uncharacterized protein n=2 Tax=Clostridium perfringens TaxID=1502 RepID=A0A8H9R104_CLOPF|nr:hypothetical protein [Clostridium perfringens]YP_008058956.1 hypothetical protein phiCP51_0033 [Clostridium phage vB_CpeS-CP51]AGH27924.1 hypothetical protein phiCP51_0033 [Clostridium phage vB_CpeS-CP51]ALG49404.1 hypothetical protein FORC3_2027 [Clostridium perfringens]EDT14074.1 hypothetical protein AC3_2325 [Clostridium perfringens E str. JGS1987]EGT3618367.1 hypothetical protein [Clostridium perfringens]EHK2366567.1 hypothetical protein [Clostridium perfringens]
MEIRTRTVPGYKKGTVITVEEVFPSGVEFVEKEKAKVIANIISKRIEELGGNTKALTEYAKKKIEETW